MAIILFATIFTQGQTSSLDKIYRTYDQMVGLDNTGLYNGTEFTDLYPNTDGTFRYLDGFDYIKGSVVYKGQYYVDVLLKYDLLEDQLLTMSNDNLGIFKVRLISEFISEFTLKDRHFVRLTDLGKNEIYELGFNGNTIDLYIKHKRVKRERVLKSGVQYSFKPTNYYLFEYHGKYSQIESIKGIRREFPQLKTQIKDFYHSFKPLYKQDRDSFMKKLAAYMDNLPEINNL